MKTVPILTAVAALLLVASPVNADKSNKQDLIKKLSANGYTVVVVKNFNEADWLKVGVTLAAAFKTGSTAPIMAYLEPEIEQMARKLRKHGIYKNEIRKHLEASIRGKRTSGKFRFEVGLKTIDRWEIVSTKVPEIRWKKKKWGIKYPEVYMKTIQEKVNLPNWHMIYVRYKLPA